MENKKAPDRELGSMKSDKVLISNNEIANLHYVVQHFSFLGLVYMDVRRIIIGIWALIKLCFR